MSNKSKERKYPVMAIAVIAALAFAIMGTATVYIKKTPDVDVKISDSST